MIIDVVLLYTGGRGGVETVLKLMSKELIRRGYRVRVIQVFNSEHLKWQEDIDEIYSLYPGIGRYGLDKLCESYSDFIKEKGKPDIVLATHFPIITYICRKVMFDAGLNDIVPIISWLHAPTEEYGINNECLEYADAHLAISEGVAEGIKGFSKDKPIYLINNPLEIDKKVISRPKDKLNFIYVGRLARTKNVKMTLKSLKDVQGDWVFNIYGDGDERENLVEFSKEYGIEEKIVWHGWKENVWDSIDSASVLVHAPNSEGFGMVMIEALSRGIPVVSSRTDGGLHIVKDGVNGWLFDIDDYKKLTEILNDIQSEKLQLPSVEECKESISRFSLETVTDAFESSILLEYNKKIEAFKNRNEIINALQNINSDKSMEESLNVLNSFKEDILRDFIVKNNPLSCIPILNKAAILNYNNENYENVIPYLQLAYEINPKDIETLYNISIVLYNMGCFKKALSYLDQIDDKNDELIELERILKENIK